MENASKALIIAGAILIAILLISVGILVMNSVNKPLDETANEGDSMAVRMFNTKFTNYFGKNKTASDVRQVLQLIIANDGNPSSPVVTVIYYGKFANGFLSRT